MLIKPNTCIGCPLHSPPFGKPYGFSYPDGDGSILVIAEALGEIEEKDGRALVGKSGHSLFQNLARVDITREQFTLFNVIACRPPNNQLVGMPWKNDAIKHCAPNLDKVIEDTRARAKSRGETFVIVTLGRTAFQRVMGFDDKSPEVRVDYLSYIFWSEKYSAFVVAADHPAYLLRGNNHLWPVLQFAFTRAIEISKSGFSYTKTQYLCDPATSTFEQWIHDYEHEYAKNPDSTFLAFDIETPHKQGADEEEVAREDDDDYTILRCSFAYQPGRAISVPWRADYKPLLEELFSGPGTKTVWNGNYDCPRITAQMPIHGDVWDAMLMWHVLNSSLPKGLGFVTPFYAQGMKQWKHLSGDKPAEYNAQDSDALLINTIGIRENLIKNNLWDVFHRHVVKLDRVLHYMSEKGVLRDEVLRKESEVKLQGLLDGVEKEMDEAVPQAARKLKIFKRIPKSAEGMIQVEKLMPVKRCSICNLINPKKTHYKPASKKAIKLGQDNVCQDGDTVIKEEVVKLWAKVLDFKVSKVGLTSYQTALKHQAFTDRKTHKTTFDESALTRLIKKYPNDKLYPLILKHRELTKLLSTYIGVTMENGKIRGGMPIGPDGAIHTTFSHNPSTLRLASQNPNMQQLPRG